MELLIVDDASPDGSAEVVAATLEEVRPAFVRVVHRARVKNLGLVASLNELLGEARGEFVFQNDSDDLAHPDAVSTLVEALERDPRIALAVGDNVLVDEQGHQLYWDASRGVSGEPGEGRFATLADYLRATSPPETMTARGFGRVHTLLRENHVPNGKLMRTVALRAVGGWREGTVDDWDLNFRLALRFRLVFVDRILMSYRWHGANTLQDPGYAVTRSIRTRSLLRRHLWNPVVLAKVVARLPLSTTAGAAWRTVMRSSRRSRPPLE